MFFSFFWLFAFSQIELGFTRQTLISLKGDNYTMKYIDNETESISYSKSVPSTFPEKNVIQERTYFFSKNICVFIIITEPLSEIADWVNTLDQRFTKISEYKWKDEKDKVIYELSIDSKFCYITMHNA